MRQGGFITLLGPTARGARASAGEKPQGRTAQSIDLEGDPVASGLGVAVVLLLLARNHHERVTS
jgi:hypothetical protein